MKFILYNPEPEDIRKAKEYGAEKIVIIDMKDRYPEGINFHNLKQKYRRISQLWLQRWANKKIEGVSVKEVFSNDNQTYFYLLNYFFQRYFEKEGFMIRKAAGFQLQLMLLDLLDEHIVDEDFFIVSRDPNEWWAGEGLFCHLAALVCQKKKIRHFSNWTDLSYKDTSFLYRHPSLLKPLIKARIFLRYLFGKSRKVEPGKVVFFSSFRFSRNPVENNVLFGSIMKELKVPFKTIDYDTPDPKHIKTIINQFTCSNSYLGDYYTLKVFKENERLCELFKAYWEGIRVHSDFRKTLTYRGYNLYDTALPLFDFVFDTIFYLIADNINITKRILEVEKPACIVLDHDENFYGKGFMMNAKHTRIPIVALQHEAVLPTDSNHFHIKDKKALNRSDVCWRPLPTKKCVSGPAAQRILLTKCNYPKDILVLTGRPDFGKKKKTRKKYGILYAAEYVDVTKKFMECIPKPYQEGVVIKPHPEHDMDVFREMVAGTKFILADKDADIHELIAQSRVVVSDFCTVGLEAMSTGVPFVVFNPFKADDMYGFKKGGVMDTYDAISLKRAMSKVLSNPMKYLKKTRKYTREQVLPGNASKRAAEVIQNVLR